MNTDTYISLTALGQIYGVNARDVGAWLKGLGLRQPDGRPSWDAIEQGLVQERALEYGGHFWHWHREKSSTVCATSGPSRGLASSTMVSC